MGVYISLMTNEHLLWGCRNHFGLHQSPQGGIRSAEPLPKPLTSASPGYRRGDIGPVGTSARAAAATAEELGAGTTNPASGGRQSRFNPWKLPL